MNEKIVPNLHSLFLCFLFCYFLSSIGGPANLKCYLIWSTSVYLVHPVLFDPVWSNSVLLGPSCPLWSYSVLFNPLWSYLFMFCPLQSHLVHLFTLVLFSPIQSTLVILGPLSSNLVLFNSLWFYSVHFGRIWSILSTLVLFGHF